VSASERGVLLGLPEHGQTAAAATAGGSRQGRAISGLQNWEIRGM